MTSSSSRQEDELDHASLKGRLVRICRRDAPLDLAASQPVSTETVEQICNNVTLTDIEEYLADDEYWKDLGAVNHASILSTHALYGV